MKDRVELLLLTSTYFVDFAPIFFIYFCARDTGKAGQKLFSISVNRINLSGSRYIRYSTMSLSRKLRFVLSFWGPWPR